MKKSEFKKLIEEVLNEGVDMEEFEDKLVRRKIIKVGKEGRFYWLKLDDGRMIYITKDEAENIAGD